MVEKSYWRRLTSRISPGFASGVVAALVDTAGGYAGFTLFPEDSSVLTVEFKLNLLAPAKGDRIVAEGFVVKPGKSLAITRGEVHAEEGNKRTLVAIMQQTLMIMHGRAVMRGAKSSLVVVDMPFGSYEESPQAAFRTAARVMQETGAAAVKLEGGAVMAETVAFLTQRGIPVIGHVGLTPQAVNVLGGYNARGRSEAEAKKIIADAVALETLATYTGGTFAVLDKNPERIFERVMDALRDLAPVALVATIPNLFVVHPSVPARSLAAHVSVFLHLCSGRSDVASSQGRGP